MIFGDPKLRQAMAAAAERGQRDLDAAFAKIVTAMGLAPSLPPAAEAPAKLKRRHKPRPPVADGLLTTAQAAAKLGCSIKTVKGHVAAGALRYVDIGHGTKRPRKMFTDADLDAFVANQTRKEIPTCPSTSPRARHTGNSISGAEVIGFSAQRNARLAAKRKK